MQTPAEIQDVEQMRQRVGIDDVELRDEVRRLRVGDLVKLTFLAGAARAETLCVRSTSIRRGTFHVHPRPRPLRAQESPAGMSRPNAPVAATEPKAGPHGWPNLEPT